MGAYLGGSAILVPVETWRPVRRTKGGCSGTLDPEQSDADVDLVDESAAE